MVFPRQDATIIIHTGFRNANHNVIRLVPKLTTIQIVCIIARTTTGNHETAKIQSQGLADFGYELRQVVFSGIDILNLYSAVELAG